MGQLLPKPVTEIKSSCCVNQKFRVGSSSTMEDSHKHLLSLPDDPGTAFFGVFDGHEGAQYAQNLLHRFVRKRPECKEIDIEKALNLGFQDIDNALLQNNEYGARIVVLIKDDLVYCSNAGDSHAIACVNGQLEMLSRDHKTDDEIILKRITAAGGYMQYNRINSNIFQSRTPPNKDFEDQFVTAYPGIETRRITDDWEFIVLACDGIWDVMTNLEVLEFCRTRIGQGMFPEKICEELVKQCLDTEFTNSGQDAESVTVALVCLLHRKPYTNLVECCKRSLNMETNSMPKMVKSQDAL